jgi:endonuclease/exonuclease/phosphatase family metal-dependent hydrolase
MKKYLLILLVSVQLFAQTDMNVMSYNIRLGSAKDGENNWDIRKEKVTELINYYEASFIGLQEVQKFQLDFILKESPNYDYIGLPREAGELAEYSCILYNKNEFEVEQEKTIWLSTTPDTISRGWDAACNRIVTYGLFKNKKNKKKFWIANTHFDHVGTTARLESAKMIVKLIETLKKEQNVPFILSGDFNATQEEESIKLLQNKLNEASSSSATKPYGELGTWNAFDFKEKPLRQIDYIFFDKDSKINVRKFRTINDFYDFKYPSDHLPILATFTY